MVINRMIQYWLLKCKLVECFSSFFLLAKITVDPQHSQALDFVKSFLKTPSRVSSLSDFPGSWAIYGN